MTYVLSLYGKRDANNFYTATIYTTWEGTKPEKFEYLITANEILEKYTNEMEEDFMVFGRYTENHDFRETVVKKDQHIFLAVQQNNLILFLPDETLDIRVLISLWDRKCIDLVDL